MIETVEGKHIVVAPLSAKADAKSKARSWGYLENWKSTAPEVAAR